MKKYEKPQIVIENFLLSEHIAGCDTAVFTTISSCQNNFDPLTVLKDSGGFSDGSCDWIVSDGTELDYNNGKLCVHQSTGSNVFSS